MTASELEPTRHTDGASAVFLDERFTPVLLLTWIGSPSEALIERIQAWVEGCIERARARGHMLVVISDGTRGNAPSAKVRRKLVGVRLDAAVVIKIIAVISPTNPMTRGALQAMAWLLGEERKRVIVSSYAHALELAEVELAAAGLELPANIPSEAPSSWVELESPPPDMGDPTS